MKKTKFVAVFFLLLLTSAFSNELSAREYHSKHHSHHTKKVYKKYKSNSSSTFFGLNLNLNPTPNIIEQNYISTPAYVAAPTYYQPVMASPYASPVVEQRVYYSTYQQPVFQQPVYQQRVIVQRPAYVQQQMFFPFF